MRWKRWRRGAGLAAVLLAATSTLGCAGVRHTLMDLDNADLLGTTAPGLAGGEWIRPFLDDSPSAQEAPWTLLAFFRPG